MAPPPARRASLLGRGLLAGLFAAACAEDVPKHWGGPRFSGTRVLVTGGDSGIGLAAVQAFYLECAKVLLAGHSAGKSRDAWEATRGLAVPSYCPTSGPGAPQVEWAALDVTNTTAVADLVQLAVQKLGGLDVAVNDAGVAGEKAQIGDPGFAERLGLASSDPIQVNVYGTLKCMSAEIQHFLSAGVKGNIVNVGSLCGHVPVCGPLYTTSKWAMRGFTKQAALRHAKSGIRINEVDPGFVNTTMLRNGLSPTDPKWIEQRKFLESLVPNGRISEPWEMAGPITFLASDMASYMTGAVILADGGISGAGPFHAWLEEASADPVYV